MKLKEKVKKLSEKQSKKDPQKESKKDPKFQLAEDQEENLPPFPPKDQKVGDISSESPGGESEEEIDDILLEEVCKDFVSVPFEIWHILKPSVLPLSDKEKTLISKPLSRVVQKYDLQKYAKDEFLLAGFLGFAIIKRAKVKDDTDNSREKRKGKNDSSKGHNTEESSKPNINT